MYVTNTNTKMFVDVYWNKQLQQEVRVDAHCTINHAWGQDGLDIDQVLLYVFMKRNISISIHKEEKKNERGKDIYPSLPNKLGQLGQITSWAHVHSHAVTYSPLRFEVCMISAELHVFWPAGLQQQVTKACVIRKECFVATIMDKSCWDLWKLPSYFP